MYKIVCKKILNPTVTLLEIEAPFVARKAEAGQFIILRADKDGERIPLTVAGYDRDGGTVTVIFRTVGATTLALSRLNEGDSIPDFVGPLGRATDLDGLNEVCIVGGGVGCAIALPIARALKDRGCKVTGIIGFRNKDLVILEEEFREACGELTVMTDDGSFGERGNVCLPLDRILAEGKKFDRIITIGPIVMMKFVTETARKYGVPCEVSMNPIMIDGTGMCGGCRLTLIEDGRRVVKFACVDGPDFDGYKVDFDEAISRLGMYQDFERHAYEEKCNLIKKGEENNG